MRPAAVLPCCTGPGFSENALAGSPRAGAGRPSWTCANLQYQAMADDGEVFPSARIVEELRAEILTGRRAAGGGRAAAAGDRAGRALRDEQADGPAGPGTAAE